MPIRSELRHLYPPDWAELSRQVRFDRAGGVCQGCGRPHRVALRCLPDGRWFDPSAITWRDHRGRPCRWPDLVETVQIRTTRVVLAAAHMDGNPANNRWANLRSLCQRCHVLHDVTRHTRQRWITYRQRWAIGDLFLGRYAPQMMDAPWPSQRRAAKGVAAHVRRHSPLRPGNLIAPLFG